jgi:CoA:oxalate CoA-transferase
MLPGVPIKMSETPGGIRTPAPLLGEHTHAVLADWLGYDGAQIEALRGRGAFGAD